MATGRIGRYERFILLPLSMLLPVGAVAYFVQRAWAVGVLFLIVWFVVGAVGQALNRDQSFSELTHGSTPEERSSPLSSKPTETVLITGVSCVGKTAAAGVLASLLRSFSGRANLGKADQWAARHGSADW